MIECIVFDKGLNQIDLIVFANSKFRKHIYNPEQFTLSINSTVASQGYFITLIENRKPIFSGIITKITEKEEIQLLEGYDLRKLLEGIQYSYLYNKDLISKTIVSIDNTALIIELIQRVFIDSEIILSNNASIKTYTSEIRIKNIYEVLRECSINTDIYYNFYLIGTRKIYLEINDIRDLRNSTPLLINISYNEVEKIINIKDKYNQILGLGSGEDESRDFYFIDNSDGVRFPNCYLYDIREDITHDELVKRTETKFKELQFDYQVTFNILKNKITTFGVDFGLGDYITFKSRDGNIFDDLITSYKIEIKNGVSIKDYELTTGLLKGNLTDKIKELKEGGYK